MTRARDTARLIGANLFTINTNTNFVGLGETQPTSKFEISGGVEVVGVATATSFSGSLSGNATTASTLQTARTINGISFNGSANIVTNPSSGAYSNGYGTRTVQSGGSPTGGSDGDIYYIY